MYPVLCADGDSWGTRLGNFSHPLEGKAYEFLPTVNLKRKVFVTSVLLLSVEIILK